jgi:hypothetical protein
VLSSNQNATEFIFLFSYVLVVIQYYTVKILHGRSVVLLRLVGIVKVRLYTCSQISKKSLLVASCSSAFPQVSPRLPLDGFSWSFIFWDFYWNTPWKLMLYKNLSKVPSIWYNDDSELGSPNTQKWSHSCIYMAKPLVRP